MRWCGVIGYGEDVEGDLSVWNTEITEKRYTGDIIRNTRRWNDSNSVNGELNISNQISILSDPYIISNFQNIKYVEFMGTLWKVTDVEVQYPRLLLTLGGKYNGQQS
ncbi:MAG: hypothetical protein J6U54_09540 [Clostridiales bacterium]|nr:hypothetical protein [Clostridiales bacterium]